MRNDAGKGWLEVGFRNFIIIYLSFIKVVLLHFFLLLIIMKKINQIIK